MTWATMATLTRGAMLGDSYRVTGAINGGFGNSIEPRDAGDFQKLGCTNPCSRQLRCRRHH